jgi:hypothetical protein
LERQNKKLLTLAILLVNFCTYSIECVSIPEENLGQNDWYRIWFSPKIAHCSEMILDPNNNIYLAGYTYIPQNPLDYDMLLIKYQNNSDYSISTSWNSTMYDQSYDLALDSSNNIYLAGVSGNYSNTYYTLVKFDNDLNYQWNRTWGTYENNRCFSVAIDSHDNIYLGGHVMRDGHFDICLVKYSSSGDFQWNEIWSASHYSNDFCFAIIIDSLDNIFLVGKMKIDYAYGSELCLLKYNSSGDLQWSIIRDAPNSEIGLGLALALDSKDNVYVVGQIGSIESILVKYNKDGIFQWERIYSGDMYCYSTEIAVDSTDNVYIGGENKLIDTNGPSASVVKYNNNGTLLHHIEWGEPYIDACGGIAIDSMDNVLLAGEITAYEYHINGIFIVRNPRTLTTPVNIEGFSIIGVIFCILLGILLSILILFKKNKMMN